MLGLFLPALNMFTLRNIIRFAVLTPVVVILLTIGWYQQAIDHANLPDNTIVPPPADDTFIIAGYFINWYCIGPYFNHHYRDSYFSKGHL